ncbi:hypothetical protein NA57DRAFT_81960 [Rhizodiscina lignyota]|uniref:Zn(2)-C6 fungal-type domain-containing protein n=1 Tax=Rhizodiscina lignyota TaxID=1504668 RepID=A0A9P4I438_9PEZI|nr:hypothetical protein NA57DRAFT_81960 [Rhizodiscina lignyota]
MTSDLPSSSKRTIDGKPKCTISPEPESQAYLKRPRHKLPYYRTSIACKYCRNRKTRCVLGPLKQKGKCRNCERLGRECVFLTVDKDPPSWLRKQSQSESTSGNDVSKYDETREAAIESLEMQCASAGTPNLSPALVCIDALNAYEQPTTQSLPTPFCPDMDQQLHTAQHTPSNWPLNEDSQHYWTSIDEVYTQIPHLLWNWDIQSHDKPHPQPLSSSGTGDYGGELLV